MLANILDLVTDVMMLFQNLLPNKDSYFQNLATAAILSLSLTGVLNLITVIYFLNKELKNSLLLGQWLRDNSTTTSVITVLSFCNAGIFQLISSRILGIQAFCAPVSRVARQRM